MRENRFTGTPDSQQWEFPEDQQRYAAGWNPGDHPRGQPENAGEFAPKGQGSSGASGEYQPYDQPKYDTAALRLSGEIDHASRFSDLSKVTAGYQALKDFRTDHHDPKRLLDDLSRIGLPINPVSALNFAGFKQSPQAIRNELDAAMTRIKEPAADDWIGTSEMLHEIDNNPEMAEVATRIHRIAVNSGGNDRSWSKMKYSDGMGHYTPERQARHDQIVQRMLNPNAVAKPGVKPQALVLLGAPGAGKTTVSNALEARLGVQCVDISNDDIKAGLDEYEGWNSALLHDEAGDVIENDLIPKVMSGNYNMLWDGTGKDGDKTEKIVNMLADKGYDVHIGYASLPSATAAYRATMRFLSNSFGHRDPNAPPGRYVDPHYIVSSVDGRPGQTYNRLKANKNVKSWVSIDTSQPTGQPLKIIDEGSR